MSHHLLHTIPMLWLTEPHQGCQGYHVSMVTLILWVTSQPGVSMVTRRVISVETQYISSHLLPHDSSPWLQYNLACEWCYTHKTSKKTRSGNLFFQCDKNTMHWCVNIMLLPVLFTTKRQSSFLLQCTNLWLPTQMAFLTKISSYYHYH